ncbi:MAG: hypothetical protein JXA42_17595 [Anaerolineales bacterium]|nr:hypothetical protein [Anaerolineales bacterium]
MKDDFNQLFKVTIQNQEQAIDLMEKLFDVAKPGAAFAEPVTAEGHTVITASEVTVGLGYGFGTGGGFGPNTAKEEKKPAEEESSTGSESLPENQSAGMGSGGGGGGGAGSRPVAVIIIEKDSVRVEPVMDVTKVALAFFTMLGSIFLMGSKMRQAANKK